MGARSAAETMDKGRGWNRTYYWREADGTTPIALTGYDVTVRVKESAHQTDADALLALTRDDAEVTVDDDLGSIAVALTAAQTAALVARPVLWVAVTVDGPSTEAQILAEGPVVLLGG